MNWSENARLYALAAVLFGGLGYVLFRKDYLGPAILFWGAGACFAVVASPRGA